MKKSIVAVLLCAVLLCGAFFGVCAEELTPMSAKGIVTTTSSNLNIRSGPGTDYDKAGAVAKSSVVTISGSVTGNDGNLWYKISAKGIGGYVRADYISIIEDTQTEDADFEAELSAFPESYKPALRQMHALHPTWRFTALVTNLSWATVMENECKIGRNLIQEPSAWLSYEKGARYYDEDSGAYAWQVFDSGGWKQACNEAIAYYMDPRNFLDGDIFQFMVLSNDGSTVSEEVINEILKGTFMYDTECQSGLTYAAALIKAADEAGASPYMLAARIKLEQGSVGNKLAHGTVSGYEGYYNYFDIGAYAHDGRSAITNGAIYAANEKRNWDTPYKAILGGAQFLVKNYIAKEQNTLYLQKYDVTDGGNGYYTHQYMTNISAAVEECGSLRDAILDTSAKDSAITFLIPVYDDMPEENCVCPLKTGNGNNLLSSLSIDGFEFNEAFDTYTQEYEITVTTNLINISATADCSDATVSGAGAYTLKEGTNEIAVTVKATNGNTRVYKLFITAPDHSVTSSVYRVTSGYITDIRQGTTVATILSSVSVPGNATVTDSGGVELDDGEQIKNGCKLVVTGDFAQSRVLVISGDSNGDGKLTSRDLLKTQKHILQIATIDDEIDLLAADFNSDGKINSRDLLACQKRILSEG